MKNVNTIMSLSIPGKSKCPVYDHAWMETTVDHGWTTLGNSIPIQDFKKQLVDEIIKDDVSSG